ncbi:MAG TPA: ferritin-like domain-containing protein [Pseudomonadota bacterium]|nr:ferritin-like domain-containing protein [Pseudomonadota bacterium]
MKTHRLDLAFLRILLVAVPFGCGPKKFTEPAPTGSCEANQIVQLSDIAARDGGSGGDGGVRFSGDGGVSVANTLSDADCIQICTSTSTCQPIVNDGGTVTSVECIYPCYAFGCGRRPQSLPLVRSGHPSALVRYLEEAAYLEAASVFAFRRLARELLAHDAPSWLVAWADRAANEEVRHARVMARLCRRYGGTLTMPVEGPQGVRPLAEIARENAQEGCVRETYGALLLWIQSASATQPHLQRVLQVIAREETEHAKLAFSVADFCASRLSDAERAEVDRAQQAAVADLGEAIAQNPPVELQQRLGLPPVELAQQLYQSASRELWTMTATAC